MDNRGQKKKLVVKWLIPDRMLVKFHMAQIGEGSVMYDAFQEHHVHFHQMLDRFINVYSCSECLLL